MALVQCHFFSDVLGLSSSMTVVLPQVPARNGDRPRPPHQVLYLLHGMSDDHTIWQRRTSIERYVADWDLVVIMPAVHRSFYADMAHGYRYWSFLSDELPAIVHALFNNLSEDRQDTFVAGLSMGGYGAFKWAMTCPERFAAAASLSGVLDLAHDPPGEDLEIQAELQLVFGDLDQLAESPNDLLYLARQLAQSSGPKPRLYQCCGVDDFLYGQNVRFWKRTQSLALDLTYEEGPGDHDWAYWDQQIQRVLDWLPLRSLHSSASNA